MSFLHFQVLCQPNALFEGDYAAHILQTWDVSDNQSSWASFCSPAVHQCSVDIDGADISISLQTFYSVIKDWALARTVLLTVWELYSEE